MYVEAGLATLSCRQSGELNRPGLARAEAVWQVVGHENDT